MEKNELEGIECRETTGCSNICKQLGELSAASGQNPEECYLQTALKEDSDAAKAPDRQEVPVVLGGSSDGFPDLRVPVVDSTTQLRDPLYDELISHTRLDIEGPLSVDQQVAELHYRTQYHLHNSKSVVEKAGMQLTFAVSTMSGASFIEERYREAPPISKFLGDNGKMNGEDLTDDLRQQLEAIDALARIMVDREMIDETGIIIDQQTSRALDEATKILAAGEHVLFQAEPGVAKTNLTKLLSRLNDLAHGRQPAAPLIESADATATIESWLSKITDVRDGDTIRVDGKLATAMKQGRLFLIDEINGLDPNQRQALNDIALLKPGNEYSMPDGSVIIVKIGFGIVASQNPNHDNQGQKRTGRDKPDNAAAARFNQIELGYPYEGDYNTFSRIALVRLYDKFGVSIVTGDGEMPELHKALGDVVNVATEIAKAASVPATSGTTTSLLNTSSGKPALSACVSPRDLDKIFRIATATASSASEAANAILQGFVGKARQLFSSGSASDNRMLKTVDAKLATLGT